MKTNEMYLSHFRDKIVAYRNEQNQPQQRIEKTMKTKTKIETSITRLKRFAIVMIIVNVLFASYVINDVVTHDTQQPVEHNTNESTTDTHDDVVYRLLMNIERNNDDNTITVLQSSVLVEIANESITFNELD